MSRRLLGTFAAITILFMVLPPLFDTFDTWDKTPEIPIVGHNTETTLAMMAVDLGLCATVAWASILLLNWLAVILAPRVSEALVSARAGVRATDYLLLLFSPPWAFTALRI